MTISDISNNTQITRLLHSSSNPCSFGAALKNTRNNQAQELTQPHDNLKEEKKSARKGQKFQFGSLP